MDGRTSYKERAEYVEGKSPRPRQWLLELFAAVVAAGVIYHVVTRF